MKNEAGSTLLKAAHMFPFFQSIKSSVLECLAQEMKEIQRLVTLRLYAYSMFLSNDKAKQNEGIKEDIQQLEADIRDILQVPDQLSRG